MRSAVVAVLAVAVLVVATGRARASCGSPSTALSPPSGATLPPFATIYLFDTDGDPDVHDSLVISDASDAQPIRFRATAMDRNASYTVHRIELHGLTSRAHAIEVHWRGALLARYVVAGDGAAAVGDDDHARVVDVTRTHHRWMCSFGNTIDVAVEGTAIAYRLDWDDDHTTVLADRRLMWSGDAAGRAVLELGHPDCMTDNVARDEIATSRTFELSALYADGRVQHLGTSVARLGDDDARLPVELIRGADVRFPRRFDVAVTTSPRWVLETGAAGGAAGVLVMFALVRRPWRRRRHRARAATRSGS